MNEFKIGDRVVFKQSFVQRVVNNSNYNKDFRTFVAEHYLNDLVINRNSDFLHFENYSFRVYYDNLEISKFKFIDEYKKYKYE